eukprot:2049344-Ditylum_brightwellii.AAC.1
MQTLHPHYPSPCMSSLKKSATMSELDPTCQYPKCTWMVLPPYLLDTCQGHNCYKNSITCAKWNLNPQRASNWTR